MKYLLAALAVSFAVPAYAQSQCAPRATITEMLTERAQESVQSMGIMSSGSIIEMWANTETGTWSIVVTHPDGTSCLPAYGGSYEFVNDPVQPTGERL